MERLMPPDLSSTQGPFPRSFSRESKDLNCPCALNDHVVTIDHVNDPRKSSVQCNVVLQKNRVSSAKQQKQGMKAVNTGPAVLMEQKAQRFRKNAPLMEHELMDTAEG